MIQALAVLKFLFCKPSYRMILFVLSIFVEAGSLAFIFTNTNIGWWDTSGYTVWICVFHILACILIVVAPEGMNVEKDITVVIASFMAIAFSLVAFAATNGEIATYKAREPERLAQFAKEEADKKAQDAFEAANADCVAFSKALGKLSSEERRVLLTAYNPCKK